MTHWTEGENTALDRACLNDWMSEHETGDIICFQNVTTVVIGEREREMETNKETLMEKKKKES